jgi:hypothetical protein
MANNTFIPCIICLKFLKIVLYIRLGPGFYCTQSSSPVPASARSKTWVCGSSPAEIMGSSPTGVMDVCLLWVLCFVRYRSLRRDDHLSRGVLSSVVCRSVWSRNLMNEEALARCRAENKQKLSSLQPYLRLTRYGLPFWLIKLIFTNYWKSRT